MRKIFILIIFILLLTGCTDIGSQSLDEKNTPGRAVSQDDLGAARRINELREGRTPQTEGSKTSPPPVPPPPPMPANPPQTKPSATSMPNQDDLASKFSQALIKTNQGDITLKFYADKSPKTVNNFLNLANDGFYDNTRFHRVINDFMIQGGDPLSKDIANKDRWGTGDPGYKFADEFNDQPLQKGSLAMANSGPNTNGSQFFIVTKDFTPWLDGKHTNFGYVSEGLDIVEKIEALPLDSRDRPREDVIVESISLIE